MNNITADIRMKTIQMPSFYIPIITLFFGAIFFYKITKTKRFPLPPGPTPIPIFGCLFQMLTNKPKFKWIHHMMDEMNTEIACIRVGNVHIIPVISPELAREFLKKQDETFSSRPDCMSSRLTSNGYLGSVLSPFGDQWKKMRRVVVNEMLSPAKHTFFNNKRKEEADHMVRYVYNQSMSDGMVNVRTTAQHYSGNVIKSLVFGKRFFGAGIENGGPGFEEREHMGGLFTVLSLVYGFNLVDYFPWMEVLDLDGFRRNLNKGIENVTKYQDPVIDERVRMWKKGMKDKEDDLLDVLINLKDSDNFPLLTTEEIKTTILEIVVAVVDNPSNALEWALGEMINQPEIFERAQNELDNVVGKDRWVQESDIPKLNFVKACAKEAFRLHPIAPFNLPHVSTCDTMVSGYFIPKGSHVLLSRFGLGRNPRVWTESLKYRPERHMHEDGSNVSLADHDLRMISFSTGRRGCPAISLGSTITIMLFARLIQGFTWTAPNDEGKIDLVQSKTDMHLVNPLIALAKPRLNANLYEKLQDN